MAGSVVFTVILIGAFLIGAGGFLTLIIVGMVRSARDRRSRNERLADEHGDLAPGTFKLTPGFGGGDIDGGTGGL
jgi:hypothetical protein